MNISKILLSFLIILAGTVIMKPTADIPLESLGISLITIGGAILWYGIL